MENKNEKRVVRDFWHALKVSFLVGIFTFAVLLGTLIYLSTNKFIESPSDIKQIFVAISVFSFLITIRVYIVYIKGVALNGDKFSWPASDVENGFIDLITLKRIRGFFYREEINALDIEYVTNDFAYSGVKGSKQKIYGLNITGAFGSRNIRFYSKQKRDEARNILRNFSKTKIEADIAFN